MKPLNAHLVLTRLLVVVTVIACNEAVGAETNTLTSADTNSIIAPFVQAIASTNISKIILLTPELEKLWPAEPKAYFQHLRTAGEVLNQSSNPSADAIRAMGMAFDQVVAKRITTTNARDASLLLELHEYAILSLSAADFYLYIEDPSRILKLAKYEGEIRSLLDTNYLKPYRLMIEMETIKGRLKTQYPNDSPEALAAKLPEAISNDEQRYIDAWSFQVQLRSTSESLTHKLIFSRLTINNVEFKAPSADLLKQIAEAAKFTPDEIKKLRGEKPWNE